MSFDKAYDDRYNNVFVPAISAVRINGERLQAKRVDLSNSGDSILTEILDGIAHSQLILADVSSCGKDVASGRPFRNGNVMFEVGIAIACRQPGEVLIIRDDQDKFLFDLSAIPHKRFDFTRHSEARTQLTEAISARLTERQYIHDCRVQRAVRRMSRTEAKTLASLAQWEPDSVAYLSGSSGINMPIREAIHRLLDKQLIEVAVRVDDTQEGFRVTPFGRAASAVANSLPHHKSEVVAKDESPPDID